MALSDADVERIATRTIEKMREEFPILSMPPVVIRDAARPAPVAAQVDPRPVVVAPDATFAGGNAGETGGEPTPNA